jgi:hypothetical protein
MEIFLLSCLRHCWLASISQLLLNWVLTNSESETLYDWRFTVNQFVSAPSPLRLTTSIFFQLNTFDYSPYITSSLTKGWVCRLQLLLALASAVILGSESRRTHDHILLSQTRDSLTDSGSKLLYDWWFTANLFVFATSPLRLTTSNVFLNWALAVIVLM